MALVPYVGEGLESIWSGLNAREKAVVLKSMYDEGKGAIKSVGRAMGKSSKKSRKRSGVQSAQKALTSLAKVQQPLRNTPSTYAPTAMSTTIRQSYSRLLQAYTVTHKEFITDVYSSELFVVNLFRINAGNSLAFPWLARIALNFEQYLFKRLTFYLKTTSPTSTTGTVMMAIDYDPTDAPPISKAAILQYEGAVRSAPWNDCACDINQKSASRIPKYYVAPIAATDSATQRLQDIGNLFVATQGQANTSVSVAELWVEYTVDLITPQSTSNCLQQQYTCSGGFQTPVVDTNKYTQGNIFSLLPTTNTWQCNVAGNYMIHIRLVPGTPATVVGAMLISINGGVVPDFGPFMNATGTAITDYGYYVFGVGDQMDFAWDFQDVTDTFTFSILEIDTSVFAIQN